jgi:adenylate cyclase
MGSFLGLQMSIQNKFYDFASASPDIVIVAIDDKSLSDQGLGAWQKWPRENYAKAIDILNKAGAAVIGIDVTFPNQSINGVTDDETFRDALTKNKNVVLAGRYYFDNHKKISELPNSTLLDAKPQIGWLNVKTDEDGFVRELPVFSDSEKGGTYEAFSLQMVRDYFNDQTASFQIQNHTYDFADNIQIPVMTKTDTDSNQTVNLMYINYFAEPGSYTRISMSDLLNKNITDQNGNHVDLKDKIVLIGPTATDLHDYFFSPVSNGIQMPGVEIHANNIQTIIDNKFLRDQSALSMWLTLLGIIALNIFLFARLRIRFSLPILFAELFAVVVAGIIAYDQRIFLNVVYPIIAIGLTFIGTFLLRFLLEQSGRKFIQTAFGHYINKTVVEQILKDPKVMEIGGAKRDVTVFFSDIADFTNISEKMEPEQLVKFMNQYLEGMTNVIIESQGTLDKYIGDSIMAFWGAPLPLPTHPDNCCRAALDMQKKLVTFRAECLKQGLPAINIRIGINSGEVIVGNMGSEGRFDYTVMGDNVNLASRLESINKQYHTEIIISEFTYEQVKEKFVCRELDQIRVKGKDKPVRIYELICVKEDAKPEMLKSIQDFRTALILYRGKNFVDALSRFSLIHDDPTAKMFAERCEEFIKNPPAGDWDGVYTFTTK